LPHEEEWEKDVRTGAGGGKFFKPSVGTFTVKITGPITKTQAFNRLNNVIPTDQGAWTTNSYAVLRAVKEYKQAHGKYVGVRFTFKAEGQGLKRRYEFVKAKA
jgi:hypothetical protein